MTAVGVNLYAYFGIGLFAEFVGEGLGGFRGVKVRISDDSLSFSELFVASMKKLPIFAEVVGVPLVESGALFILMSP